MDDIPQGHSTGFRVGVFAAALIFGALFAYSSLLTAGYDALWGTVLIVLICVTTATFARLAGPLMAAVLPVACYALLVLMLGDFARAGVLLAQFAPAAVVLSVCYLRKSQVIKNTILMLTVTFLLCAAGAIAYDIYVAGAGFTGEGLMKTLDGYFTGYFAPYYELMESPGIMTDDMRQLMLSMVETLRATYNAYLPAIFIGGSLIKAYLAVFVTGWLLRKGGVYAVPTARVWRRTFSVSPVGGVLFGVSFIAMIIATDPFFGMAAANIALTLAFPLALQGISVLTYLYGNNNAVRRFTLPVVLILLFFTSLTTVMFILSGLAVVDCFRDLRKIRPKEEDKDV